MFGDYAWLHDRTLAQNHAFDRFIKANSDRTIVVIEMGAGKAIPTIRKISERIGQKKQATVIRINLREPTIRSPHILIPQYRLNYYNIRYHLRWLFFGSPNPFDGKPDEAARHSNGYVVNGLRMDDKGFARLNAGLHWPLAEDDPILDHDIPECFMEFDQSRVPEQYNAICPLDGYVLAINAEYYWRLPPGEHVAEDGPDSVYRLCPHCLMDLASRNIIQRSVRGVE